MVLIGKLETVEEVELVLSNWIFVYHFENYSWLGCRRCTSLIFCWARLLTPWIMRSNFLFLFWAPWAKQCWFFNSLVRLNAKSAPLECSVVQCLIVEPWSMNYSVGKSVLDCQCWKYGLNDPAVLWASSWYFLFYIYINFVRFLHLSCGQSLGMFHSNTQSSLLTRHWFLAQRYFIPT